MLETRINKYGQDKLKNLAQYKELEFYPILHKWADLHQIEPNRKFILYFAIPDDNGNVLVIPAKWCEDITEIENNSLQMVLELNNNALEQLQKVGKFSNEFLYPILHTWEHLDTRASPKKKFDVFFAILNDEKKVFIVQSTWGRLLVLDNKGKSVYTR